MAIETSHPVVSVCVQTYQHRNFIRQCLDGILAQKTNFDFEICLGEDASTDGTREICIEYADAHPEVIQLVLHDRKNVIYINGRPTGRYNFMHNLERARGKYIALCDGDDVWDDETKLQKQYDFMEANQDYVLCFHRAMLIDENGDSLDPPRFIPSRLADLSSNDIVANAFIPFSTCLFRNVVLELPESFKRVANPDSFLFSLLGQFGKGGYLADINDSLYRQHGGGIWSSRAANEKQRVAIETFEDVLDCVSEEYKKPVREKLVFRHQMYLLSLIKQFKLSEYFKGSRNFIAFQKKHGLSIVAGLANHLKILFVNVVFRKKPSPPSPD